jgi:hypothetical protein
MSAAVNSRGSVSGAMSGTGANTEAAKELEGKPLLQTKQNNHNN